MIHTDRELQNTSHLYIFDLWKGLATSCSERVYGRFGPVSVAELCKGFGRFREGFRRIKEGFSRIREGFRAELRKGSRELRKGFFESHRGLPIHGRAALPVVAGFGIRPRPAPGAVTETIGYWEEANASSWDAEIRPEPVYDVLRLSTISANPPTDSSSSHIQPDRFAGQSPSPRRVVPDTRREGDQALRRRGPSGDPECPRP